MQYKKIIGDRKIEQEQINLGKKAWPEFMQHDKIVADNWACLYSDFLNYQFAAYSDDKLIGVGNSIPLFWEGEFQNLPSQGLDWAMEKAVDDLRNGISPNLLVGAQILINPELRSKGLSYEFLDLMKHVAQKNGIKQMALPVRPTLKHLYPLIPMEEYIRWTNENGEPFDPWIRVHLKTGAKLISVCSESMVIRDSVNDWEQWTGLSFKSSGLYIVKQALCPVTINLEKNFGEYIEPNVWIVHEM